MSGIGNCRIDIRACHREDQLAHETLSEMETRKGGKALPRTLTPNGPGRAEAKQGGSATEAGARVMKKAGPALAHHAGIHGPLVAAEHGAAHGLKAFAARAASEAGKKGAELGLKALHGISLAAWIATGLQVAAEAHAGSVGEAKSQGQRESDGLYRDAMRTFILKQGGSVFSPEFRSFMTRDVHAASKQMATQMEFRAAAARGSASLDAERVVVQTMAKQGIAVAKSLGITTGAALEKALGTDPAFAEKFQSSTAFRLGVAAHVYEAWRAAQR
ncbi:MAG: hypothetical protein IPM35_14980 [Myxococcales bacterium]|nr:hypothetical protein [Myxococcales bacterium]